MVGRGSDRLGKTTKLKITVLNIAMALLPLSFLAALVSCSGDEPDVDGKSVDRAVLVYMAADNSLGSAGNDVRDLDEMCRAAAAGDLGESRLIVYHASRNANPELVEITAEGQVALKSYDYSPSSVTIERMREVFADFKSVAKAGSYGLILWSHASGWIQNGVSEPASSQLSFGDERGRYMNVTSLAVALDGEPFDYVWFDCCYMANIESLYQLRHAAPVIVASVTELPADGMPYDETLRYLTGGSPDLYSAAEATFNHYNSLTGSRRTCTISVVNTPALDRLASATRAIYSSCQPPLTGYSPQPFMTSGCYLFDFKDYVHAFNCSPDLKSEWDDAFGEAVGLSLSTPMLWNVVPLERCNGLSCYILESLDDSSFRGYSQLEWWSDVASHLLL